jgi:putative transposase
VSERGAPSFLRSDNGPEFVSRALLSWIVTQKIGIALIEPGKPWQNGVGERWRRHYNEVRPHSSLDYLTPAAFARRLATAAPRDATGRGAAVSGACAPRPVASPSRLGQPRQAGAILPS